MSSQAELKRGRELVELDVGEVSVVDRPAIRREFLVLKRHQEETMGAFSGNQDRDYIDPSTVSVDKAAKPPQSTGCGGEDAEKKKAAAEAEDAEKKKAVAKKRASAKRDAAKWLREKADAESDDVEKRAKKDAAEEMEKAAKMDDEETEKAFGKPGKPGDKPENENPFATGKQKTQKNESGPDDLVIVKSDGSVVISGQPIEKARAFTAARTDTIKSSVSSLLSMLKEVDEEAYKAIVAQHKADLPSNATVESMVRPMSPEVKKMIDDQTVVIKNLEGKIEQLEKARQPATSVNGQGGTDVKVNKGFWSGVL